MRTTRCAAFVAAAAATLTFGLTACGDSDTESSGTAEMMTSAAMSEQMTSTAAAPTRMGAFSGLNGKTVAGTATVDGERVTLSNFSSDEGPDLHIYLTNGTDEAAIAAGKQISAVSYDSAMQTFMLNGVDAATYSTVVIHCDKAKAVFGAATLS